MAEKTEKRPVIRIPSPRRLSRRGQRSEYYDRIASRLRWTKIILAAAVFVFMIGMFWIYRGEITVENMRYLARYLNTDSPEYTGNYRTIYFNASNKIQIGSYKGEVAVADEKSVTLYNMLGNATLSYPINCRTPVMLTGDRYMVVYGLGENTFTVNNAISRLYSETLEYPIWGASLSSDGMLAVTTNTMEYRSAVMIYDRGFKKVAAIYKDKLVMDTVFRSDELALMLSVYNEGGEFMSEIMVFNPYDETPKKLITLKGEMAMKASWLDGGGFAVLCDDALLFFNQSYDVISNISFNGAVPERCGLSERGAELVFSQNIIGSGERIDIYDTHGEQLWSLQLEGQILDIKSDYDYIYALFDSAIVRISAADGTTARSLIESGGKSLIRKDQLTLIVAYTQSVQMLRTEELFPEANSIAAGNTSADAGYTPPGRTETTAGEPAGTETGTEPDVVTEGGTYETGADENMLNDTEGAG